jgi:hypothetical protein
MTGAASGKAECIIESLRLEVLGGVAGELLGGRRTALSGSDGYQTLDPSLQNPSDFTLLPCKRQCLAQFPAMS